MRILRSMGRGWREQRVGAPCNLIPSKAREKRETWRWEIRLYGWYLQKSVSSHPATGNGRGKQRKVVLQNWINAKKMHFLTANCIVQLRVACLGATREQLHLLYSLPLHFVAVEAPTCWKLAAHASHHTPKLNLMLFLLLVL